MDLDERGKKRELSVSPTAAPPAKANKVLSSPELQDQCDESGLSADKPQQLTVEELAEELLTQQLSANKELNDQSKEIVRLTISITAQLIQSQSSSTSHLQNTVSHLSSSLTKLEHDVIHHERLIMEHSKTLKDYENTLTNITLRCEEIVKIKDKEITDLKDSFHSLKNNYSSLKKDIAENKFEIDATNQYERRDTLIFSGPAIPKEANKENLYDILVNLIQVNLLLPLGHTDISVCHRLGVRSQGRERPIICKFISRYVSSEIRHACNFHRPGFYANESLTPIRRDIFHKLRMVRKDHPTLIENLYTIDGKIMIKTLTNERIETITNPINLEVFLGKYPAFKESYENVT